MAGGSGPTGLNVLFFLRGGDLDSACENLLRGLLAHGHQVHVGLDHQTGGPPSRQARALRSLSVESTSLSWQELPARTDAWRVPAAAIRRALDQIRFLGPDLSRTDALPRHPSRLARLLVALPRSIRRGFRGMLRSLEAALPIPRAAKRLIRDRAPDVVLVSPLVETGSNQSEYVRAAVLAGVPSVLLVSAWDDLSSKGVVRDEPALTLVWNEAQLSQAVNQHGLAVSTVSVAGAHTVDHLFALEPAASRERFATRLGLDPGRPLVVYAGSSPSSVPHEPAVVRTWLRRLREDPRTRDLGVVLRPHPDGAEAWRSEKLDEPGKTVIWPAVGEDMETPDRDQFEALHHATVVVGTGSGALIEGAVARRPVLALSPETAPGERPPSIPRLPDTNGGAMPLVADSWDAHIGQLADAVEAPDRYHDRLDAFLAQVVRPAGLDTPAAPRAVERIEGVAGVRVEPSGKGRVLRPLLWLLTPLLVLLMLLLQPRRTARALWKALRRVGKAARTLGKRLRRRVQLARGKDGRMSVEERARERERLRAAGRREERPRLRHGEVDPEQERQRAMKAEEKEQGRAEKEKRAHERALKEEKARLRAEKEERAKARAARAEEKSARDETSKAEAKAARKAARAAAKQKPSKEAPTAEAGESVAAAAVAPTPKPAASKSGGGARKLRGRARKFARGRAKVARKRWKYTRRGVRRVYNRRHRGSYTSTIMKVPSRDELPALLNARGLTGRGVEIGVKTGLYSDELLSNWEGAELVSIDPWLSADPDEYVDRSNVSQDEFEQYYQQTQERLSKHGSRSTIWRMTSIEAAPHIQDGTLDFVYIDARHDYDSVKEDLYAWVAKVKPGGILAGHDYVDGEFPQGSFYVKSAVDEFFGERGIPVRGTEGPSAVELFPTWIVEVPEEGIDVSQPAPQAADQSHA